MTAPVAIVTGASRGIGHHLAAALEEAGYAVERGSRAVAPVTDPAAVEGWVAEVIGRHGRVDLLVNNAGVIDREVGLLESDPDQWWETIEVNLRGPYLMTRAVLPHMVAAGSGRIVNINSGAAYRNYDIATAYNVGKGALARLTAATGLNADRGVRAFDLAPGVVRTDMTEAMDAHRDRTEWTAPDGGGRPAARHRPWRARRLERPDGARRHRHPRVVAGPGGRRAWPSRTARWACCAGATTTR